MACHSSGIFGAASFQKQMLGCTRKLVEKMLLVLVLVMLADLSMCVDVEINQIERYPSVDRGSERKDMPSSVKEEDSVSLMWGISDTTATVGRKFSHHIPSDAFKGKIIHMKAVEAGKQELPSWLIFIPEKHLLLGLPLPKDVGRYSIEVIALGESSEAKDTFDIIVTGDGSAGTALKYKSNGPRAVRCKREEPETTVTIVVDGDLDGLSAETRLNILGRLMSHLNVAEEMLKLQSVGNKPWNDSSALVSGPGDVKVPQHSGILVSWLVGCGKVESDHMPVLQQVEADSANGVLANAIGHSVLGWHVTNSRFQQVKRRKRQAVRATATQAVTPTPPLRPPTETIVATGTSESDTMTREVPSMESPTFSIQPTQTLPPMTKMVTPEMTPEVGPDDGKIKPSRVGPDGPLMTKTEVLPTYTVAMTSEPPTKTMPTKATQPTTEATMEKTTPKVPPSKPECTPGMPPVLENPINKLTFTAGDFVRYKIPDNTFMDCEVGNTRKLGLRLFRGKSEPIKKNFWLQFDERRQMLHGLPLKNDIGDYEFTLIALKDKSKDKEVGVIQTNMIKVRVKEDPNQMSGLVNHELSLTMNMNYSKFMEDVDNTISLANKISRLYGERHAKSITITNIKQGSVIFSWTNNTLSSADCPVDKITAVVQKLAKEDGSLSREAERALRPFSVKQAGVAPRGSCEGNPNFPSVGTPGKTTMKPDMKTDKPPMVTVKPDMMDKSSTETPEVSTTENVLEGSAKKEDDMWVTTVVPAVVIVAILLIALLIACILYRKKRKGKMNLEDRNTFINKNVPVILPDELEEKPADSSKPLLIEGSPPAPPPEYQRGASESPVTNHKHPSGLDDPQDQDIDETDATTPLYPPPPPVMGSGGNKQPRPHVQQPVYRSQPPTIPP